MIWKFEDTKQVNLMEGHLKMGESSSNGDVIAVNNLYITKNGKPFIPVMAEIHYARLPRSEWEDRIIKMKANGINVISTYLFWIRHEEIEGKFDFTGDNDIRYFVSLCQKHGLYCTLRIGPWITAECRNGGLPEWLYLKGIKLRDIAEPYMSYVRRWYEKVYEQIKDFMFRDGGNIIAIQFENEITHATEYMKALKDMAIEIGITAPLYTATGWNLKGGAKLPQDEMLPMWGGYVAWPWRNKLEELIFHTIFKFFPARSSTDTRSIDPPEEVEINLPNDRYPYTCAEQGVGITATKKNRPLVSYWDTYSANLTKLGCGINMTGYYVFSGGKNALGINNMNLNWNNLVNRNANLYPIMHYDFQAPIDIYGNLKDSYRYLKLINYFLQDFGEELAPMQVVYQIDKFNDTDTDYLRYAIRTKNGNSGYLFVNNHIHGVETKTFENVQFELNNGKVIPSEPITVKPSASFMLPFGVKYGKSALEYATAQPICKEGNTYFFVEIEGIKPVYKFEGMDTIEAPIGKNESFEIDGQRFITLTADEAMHITKVDGKMIIGDGADILSDNGVISSANFGSFKYYEFVDGEFVLKCVEKSTSLPTVSYTEVESAPINPEFLYELHAFGATPASRRKLHYYNINVQGGSDGYIYLDYYGDSAQLYIDGEMFDDHFYNGTIWSFAAKDLVDKDVTLVIAEYTEDIVIETPPKERFGIASITVSDR